MSKKKSEHNFLLVRFDRLLNVTSYLLDATSGRPMLFTETEAAAIAKYLGAFALQLDNAPPRVRTSQLCATKWAGTHLA
jgi:hypothetical protein